MSFVATDGEAELKRLLEFKRERRERLKLEILASLRVTPRVEETPVSSRGRRGTYDFGAIGLKRVALKLDADVSGMSVEEGLRFRFLHHLAKMKLEREVKLKQADDIVKMRETQEKTRKQLVSQVESLQSSRSRLRRLRRVLQTLQTRFVASTIAVQYQINRKADLLHLLEHIRYLRDTTMENALLFLFGGAANEAHPVPLGGVFSPYAFIDYDDEEERIEHEYNYLLTLTPSTFKSTAQQRRATFRNTIAEARPQFSPFIHGNTPTSIDYSSLAGMSFFSSDSSQNDHTGAASSSSSFSSLHSSHNAGELSPRSFVSSHERRASSEDAQTLLVAGRFDASYNKRTAGSKLLKPSMSDKPTTKSSATSNKKQPGFFSVFRTNK